jgi:hypothetical protein
MRALQKAIAKRFNDAGSLKTAFPGGAYFDNHPGVNPVTGAPVVYPYVVIQIEDAPAQSFWGGEVGEVQVRFQPTGVDAQALADATELLHTQFKSTLLTLTVGQCLNCHALHQPKPLPMVLDTGGEGPAVRSWLCQYIYAVRET